MAGATLTRSDIRVPRYATADLRGRCVTAVRSVGKHLFIDIVSTPTAPPLSIHSHLKMEGAWHVYRRGQRWRRSAFTARIILEADRAQAVGFQLGICELLSDPDAAVGHLGPDLLGPGWDPELAEANLAAEPGRPIGLALMDQRIMAGVGNVYRCEACFLRGVLPTTPVGDIDIRAMVDLCHRLLASNKNRVRTTTLAARGGDRMWVYGRGARPCLRCGTPIERGFLGEGLTAERVIYYCPRCQV